VVVPAVRASFVVSPHLWRPSDLRYVPEAGFSCGLHKIERLMRSQALRAATQARPAERRRRTLGLGDRAECARSPVHGGPAQPQMDCRLHPCLNSRGLVLRNAILFVHDRRDMQIFVRIHAADSANASQSFENGVTFAVISAIATFVHTDIPAFVIGVISLSNESPLFHLGTRPNGQCVTAEGTPQSSVSASMA
jgi:hypothetical protein